MNKHVQALAKQAMVPSCDEGLGGPYMTFDKELFAQLIIQECSRLIGDDCVNQSNAGVLSNIHGLNQARHIIVNHFGVNP